MYLLSLHLVQNATPAILKDTLVTINVVDYLTCRKCVNMTFCMSMHVGADFVYQVVGVWICDMLDTGNSWLSI